MGIKDTFHQQAILVCVEELCSQAKAGNGAQDEPVSEGNTVPASSHQLRQYSFSELQRCGQCKKYLRGFQHQGLVCQGKSALNPGHQSAHLNVSSPLLADDHVLR